MGESTTTRPFHCVTHTACDMWHPNSLQDWVVCGILIAIVPFATAGTQMFSLQHEQHYCKSSLCVV